LCFFKALSNKPSPVYAEAQSSFILSQKLLSGFIRQTRFGYCKKNIAIKTEATGVSTGRVYHHKISRDYGQMHIAHLTFHRYPRKERIVSAALSLTNSLKLADRLLAVSVFFVWLGLSSL